MQQTHPPQTEDLQPKTRANLGCNCTARNLPYIAPPPLLLEPGMTASSNLSVLLSPDLLPVGHRKSPNNTQDAEEARSISFCCMCVCLCYTSTHTHTSPSPAHLPADSGPLLLADPRTKAYPKFLKVRELGYLLFIKWL